MPSPQAHHDDAIAASKTPGQLRIGHVIAICLPLLVLAAVLVQFLEVVLPSTLFQIRTPTTSLITDDVPPAAAVTLFLPLLLLTSLPILRRWLDLSRGELLAIFSVLVLAVPIFGSGLWHHLVPLQLETHRTRELDRAMSVSPLTWPTRGNVLHAASAEDSPVPGAKWTLKTAGTRSVTEAPHGIGRCLQITHSDKSDLSQLQLELSRNLAPRFLRPRGRYAVWVRLRLDDPGPSTAVSLAAGIDPQNQSGAQDASDQDQTVTASRRPIRD